MRNWNSFLQSKSLSEGGVLPPPPPVPQRQSQPPQSLGDGRRHPPQPSQANPEQLISGLQSVYNKLGETESYLSSFGTLNSPEELKQMAAKSCVAAKQELAAVLRSLRGV